MNNDRPDLSIILKYHFGIPRVMTWSFPVMVLSILTLLCFLMRCIMPTEDAAIPPTSLIGYSVLVPAMALICLVIPALLLSRGQTDLLMGRYSGVGIMLVSFMSGVPLNLVSVSVYNLFCWIWLRLTQRIVFPAFFYYAGTESIEGRVLSLLSDTAIPGFACSLFFFGLLWSRFRSKERFVGYIIISLTFALYGLDFINFPSLFIIGMWCCFLRTNSMNIFGPFFCLLGIKLTSFLLEGTLDKVDLLSIRSYSDIDSTFLYSSLPSLFIGMILLSFFIKILTDFKYSYLNKEEDAESDPDIPSFDRSINLSLILSAILFIVSWVMLFKGVHL
ncbi:MAG: hypothetical protein IJ869_07500 [Clostridiales bacterium]|nr:hypothetical protein [Clostridiales bacterium]